MSALRSILRPTLVRPAVRAVRGNATSATPPPPPPPPQQPKKPLSPHIGVYKEFGRPFLKVFLMGMFTYQVIYYGWERLEKEAEKKEITGEIGELRGQVEKLVREQTSAKKA